MSGPVLTSPEDIVNAALSRIGVKMRVGSLQEGSEAAKVALDNYGQTRDDLLREGEWGFARRDATLTLLKTGLNSYAGVTWDPATYPPLPWKYEYTYPSDCLKVRSIRPAASILPDFDPQPVVFDTPNDNAYTPARKVIVCNVGPVAILTYTGQVTNPATWETTFVEAMIAAMAERMEPALAKQQAPQVEAVKEQVAEARAAVTQG